MIRCRFIKFRPVGIPLFGQPGDENLQDRDPTSIRDNLRPLPNIVEYLSNVIHRWNGMVEFMHGRSKGMDMRVDEAWKNGRPIEIDNSCAGTL